MSNLHIQWAVNILNDEGYDLAIPSSEVVQDSPWSTVYRFNTDKGYVYLKKVPTGLSIEADIIDILHRAFNAPVPHVIASNQEHCCFLMQDAGVRLHDYFKDNFQPDIFIKTMQDYAMLQIKSQTRLPLFLDMGVPDWGLKKFPELYADFITHEQLLMDDGLTENELITLNQLQAKLVSICEELSQYKISDTFGHADFHDKNILIHPDSHKTTLIDLGEVVITHPFFSLHNCLHMTKENFSLSDAQYRKLLDGSLESWLLLESHENLISIMGLIQQCWSIHAVLGEFRLMKSVDQESFKKLHRKGRLSTKLRHWIGSGKSELKNNSCHL